MRSDTSNDNRNSSSHKKKRIQSKIVTLYYHHQFYLIFHYNTCIRFARFKGHFTRIGYVFIAFVRSFVRSSGWLNGAFHLSVFTVYICVDSTSLNGHYLYFQLLAFLWTLFQNHSVFLENDQHNCMAKAMLKSQNDNFNTKIFANDQSIK